MNLVVGYFILFMYKSFASSNEIKVVSKISSSEEFILKHCVGSVVKYWNITLPKIVYK